MLLRGDATLQAGEYDKADTYSHKRWRQVQYLADIWRRWTREYLPTIQLRQKWLNSERNVELGDIVILMNDKQPRNSWPLGRVVETYPGPDGLVRTVKVITKSAADTDMTELIRPVHKLCLLESVDCDSRST